MIKAAIIKGTNLHHQITIGGHCQLVSERVTAAHQAKAIPPGPAQVQESTYYRNEPIQGVPAGRWSV